MRKLPTVFAPKSTFSSHAQGGGIAAIPAYVTGEGEEGQAQSCAQVAQEEEVDHGHYDYSGTVTFALQAGRGLNGDVPWTKFSHS